MSHLNLKSQKDHSSAHAQNFSPRQHIRPPLRLQRLKRRWYLGIASGEIYDCDALTAAHNSLPFGTRVRLTAGGNSVEVTINDRGGFQAYGREFDVTPAVFKKLAPLKVGIINVSYEILNEKE